MSSKASLTAHEARQELYAIMQADATFEEKSNQALDLGERYLQVDNVHLTQIDEETDHWEALFSTDTADGQFPPGLELDLGTTYCRRTIQAESPIALHDASNQGWADDPAFQEHGIHCYHGTTLIIKKEPFGTICFVGEDPREEAFSESETMFAELLTRFLERELEREYAEADLTRQTNLAGVLNRVLRHNLRNDITVVRGLIQQMADERPDDPAMETVFDRIDELINLGERARELEQIVTSDIKRQPTAVASLVEDVVKTVAEEQPHASLSVEYEQDISAAVRPNFERAVRELLENAIAYSGDNPTVSVTINTVPNAVEIQITDDGPGLPEMEAEVLSTGEETPLSHSSGLGLWMSNWIVTSHEGSVDTTVTDDGTTITLSIPRIPSLSPNQQLPDATRDLDRFRAAFEEALDAILLLNDGAQIINSNPAAQTLFGREWEALIGQPLTEFTADPLDFDAEWRDFQDTGTTRGTIELDSADGVERIVECFGKENIVPGEHIFVGRDITERKERERELESLKERYETLLEAAPDPVFVADAETGELIEVNEAAVTVIGEPREELVGRHQSSLHPPEDEELYRKEFKQVIGQRTKVRTLPDGSVPKLVTADDDHIPIEISVNTVSLPDGPVIYGIFRTLPERTEREKHFERVRNRLDRLTSVVSHDLRNPLNVAEGRLALAEKECDSLHLAHVAEAHERMEELIDDLLILAKKGQAVGEFEPVDLAEVSQGCWESVLTEDAKLILETDRTIQADQSRLKQLLENLLRNAVEHGGTDVTITIGSLDTGFYVEDEGRGIPEVEREDVFAPGYSTDEDGTGFGLSIVKEIVDAHGWEIAVTESEGGGCRFEITGVEFDE